MFKSGHENTYEIEIQNGMTCIHGNEVNKITEFSLIHDILNPPKRIKIYIAVPLLLYMDVWINERVERSLRTFKSYCIVDVVPRL